MNPKKTLLIFTIIVSISFSLYIQKNENLLNFDSLRKEVLKSIPNFSKLNELPNFKDFEIIDTSPYFESEEVDIKELDYF